MTITPDARRHSTRRARPRTDVACDAIAALMMLAALASGVQAVSGLRWPYDPDHFRDIAFAQTARDGHPLSDASYPNEWVWYNPLVPWLVAAGSALAGTIPAVFHVQSGPYLNVLGPIAFYVLGIRLAGRPAAVVALAIYLFFLCTEHCWACATYSPWLFTSTFSQGLFFTSVLALLAASTRPRWLPAAAAGTLAGLTFLSHTAPALLLGVLGAALLTPQQVAAYGGAALLVASPFLAAIAGHYHLRVANTLPLAWDYGPLLWPAILGTIRSNIGWFAGAAVGLVWLHAGVVVIWLAAAALLLLTELLPTPLVPIFHFWIYLLAAVALLTGVAVVRVLRGPAAIALTCALAIWHWPQYAMRQDFVLVRGLALDRDPNHAAMTAALRRLSRPEEVVLGTHGAANLIIGPAGRKVVAPHPFTSNPYVELGTRAADRDRMLKAVEEYDLAAFRPLAERYAVSLVVMVGRRECDAAQAFDALVPQERLGDVCLSRVRFPP